MEFSETQYIQALLLRNLICRGISMSAHRGYMLNFLNTQFSETKQACRTDGAIGPRPLFLLLVCLLQGALPLTECRRDQFYAKVEILDL